jgi:hypothetical protein
MPVWLGGSFYRNRKTRCPCEGALSTCAIGGEVESLYRMRFCNRHANQAHAHASTIEVSGVTKSAPPSRYALNFSRSSASTSTTSLACANIFDEDWVGMANVVLNHFPFSLSQLGASGGRSI